MPGLSGKGRGPAPRCAGNGVTGEGLDHGSTLILALDLPAEAQALSLAESVAGEISWCKVGLELFTLAGPALLKRLEALGFSLFLDLKFYDIPHTVARAVRAAASLGVDMLTLHCQGGERMCRAAAEAARACPSPPLLLGVTVLTSMGDGELPGLNMPAGAFALRLARDAAAWGLDGVVCSAREARDIKALCPELACVCPGIRPAGSRADDQARVASPGAAVAAGADFLVVGRPISQAPCPARAARDILEEMNNASKGAGNGQGC